MVVDLDRSRSWSTRVYQDFKKCQIPADLAGCQHSSYSYLKKGLPVQSAIRFCL